MKLIFLLTIWFHGTPAHLTVAAYETRAACETARSFYNGPRHFAICQSVEVKSESKDNLK